MAEPSTRAGKRIGVDVGGTFTDLALQDETTNRVEVTKVLSTTPNPADGVMQGFELLTRRSGVTADQITYLAHASTIASNLVLERKGSPTALITTFGFRDVILLQRQKRANLYDHFYDKPKPVVRRRDIYEVSERTLADGSIAVPLQEDQVSQVLNEIAWRGFESVAVVLLHSYANPAHERRIREIAERQGLTFAISLSSDVSPRWREYERSSTTAMNAYVQPDVARYLDSMQERLTLKGMNRPIHVMQCSGGLVLAEGMKQAPVTMIESGPAAGALVAGYIGRVAGRSHVVAFDMGGTTAKVSIVEDGEPRLVEDFEISPVTKLSPGSGLPISVPAVDLIEIGTGGGSIAHLDIGVLSVGPQSAGAAPGPACYGFGGAEPTVTDANLLLGYLDADYFLGGELKLDVGKAREAVWRRVADPLGVSVDEAAYAIHALANASMASAMRIVTVQRGFDPRDYVAVAFGGAGPLHISAIASEVGVPEVIVPANAGIASAVGLLVARVKFEFARTLKKPLDPATLDQVNEVFEELEQRGMDALARSRVGEGATLIRHARMRYVGQGYEITVEIPARSLDASALQALRAAFLESYRQLYGYAAPGGDLEIVDFRVTALGPPQDSFPALGRERSEAPAKASRRAYFPSLGGRVDVDVWNRYQLPGGFRLEGPAIVQERESTTLVPPGATATVDDIGNLVLTMPATDTAN